MADLETVAGALEPTVATEVRALCDAAFVDGFEDTDWEHGLGGHHVVVRDGGTVVAHASVVTRTLWVGETPRRVGYVEAVATHPGHEGRGLGSLAMGRIGQLIAEHHELGALSTSRAGFYERLGWERWRGPTCVRHPDGTLERTEDEDDGILVLRTPATDPGLDLTVPLACEPRPGDDW